MGSSRPLIFLLTIAIAALACGFPSASSSPTTAPGSPASLAPTEIPALTADSLKNAQYKLGARDDHAVIQFSNGLFQQGVDNTTADFARIDLTDFISLGDLTGDGVNEAAAVIFENYGGTGEFGFLAVYSNQNGLPVFIASQLIDDRPQINGLTIENNRILLDATTHGINDPACCPALQTHQSYRLSGTNLLLAKYISNTPDGHPHEIVITGPTTGDSASSVHLTGSITIAPFENTLSYRVTDLNGIELTAGPMSVTAPDLGAPGTFDATLDLSGAVPVGSSIILEVRDLSAADGFIIAMDSVQLDLK